MEFSAHLQEQTKKIFDSNPLGEIIMVNSSGVYLRFNEHIVFLCDVKWGLVPIGILLENFKEIAERLQLEVGQKVIFECDKLVFLNGTVRLITDALLFKKDCANIPDQKLIKRAAMELAAIDKTKGISMLVEPLVLGNKNSTAVTLNPYTAGAYSYFSRLINAFSDNAEAEVKLCVGKLLGLGTGLTPSADDVMMGMLYAFRKLQNKSPKAVKAFIDSILKLCGSCTNRISGAYLKSIIQGAYFERMECIWRGLCGTEPLEISLLTDVGSNSGAEMLLGMLIALQVCGYDIREENTDDKRNI